MIRQAETRDIPIVINLLIESLRYLELTADFPIEQENNQFTGGVIEYVAMRMSHPDSVVFINGNSILIGRIDRLPGFMKHKIVGLLEHVYPLAFCSTPLAKTFYEWARDRGATAIDCVANQTKTVPMFQRQGFEIQQIAMTKEIEV